jgi:hypothetical protein
MTQNLFNNNYVDRQLPKTLYELASTPKNKQLIVELFIYLLQRPDFAD